MGSDLRNHDSDTFTDCLNACATSGADPRQDPCRAVAYNTNVRRCWQKSGNATRAELQPAANTIMAFADDTPWLNVESTCPYTNDSIQTDTNGLQYQILCGIRHKGDNFDPEIREDYQPYHAASVDDCLDYCSKNSPLCYGVLYFPGSENGYRNCWPKNKNATTVPNSLVVDGNATTAIALLSVNSTCAGDSYTAQNGAKFDTSCDVSGSGPNLKQIHADNFGACMDECANYKSESGNGECRNVVYQPSAQDGFLNCYLKYALDNTTSQAQWHMAALTSGSGGSGNTGGGSSGSSQSSNGGTASDSNNDDNNDNNNTALIAGAVVGPVVGIALIAGLIFWWRRHRRAAHQSSAATGIAQHGEENEPFGKGSYPGSPYATQQSFVPSTKQEHHSTYSSSGGTMPSTMSGTPAAPLVEAGSGRRDTTELPGSEGQRYEMQA